MLQAHVHGDVLGSMHAASEHAHCAALMQSVISDRHHAALHPPNCCFTHQCHQGNCPSFASHGLSALQALHTWYVGR
jgi:hypothetical protein